MKDRGLQDRASAQVTPGRVPASATHARRGSGLVDVESVREGVAGLSPEYLARLLRRYDDAGPDGYPTEWHDVIKHLIREQDGFRCVRCGHPYVSGAHPMERDQDGELVSWSPCDELCTHAGEVRYRDVALGEQGEWYEVNLNEHGQTASEARLDESWHGDVVRFDVEARYRILTVHHLDGDKLNCRWWNLVSLDQRCHLNIQRRVIMGRVYPFEHTEWFKPYAAGFYAFAYEGRDLSRVEVMQELDRLLALERLI